MENVLGFFVFFQDVAGADSCALVAVTGGSLSAGACVSPSLPCNWPWSRSAGCTLMYVHQLSVVSCPAISLGAGVQTVH